MVNFYERIGKAVIDHELPVDFYGSFKPSNLQKRYPNVTIFEDILGLEYDKDLRDINLIYDLILPFIRTVAGPMDYMPGAVNNATAEDFYINFVHPASLDTCTHQTVLYVVYKSSLQMLANPPSSYYRAPESAPFISRIPTTRDDIKAITAEIGEQLVIARKNGKNWRLTGLTDWNARSIEVRLNFLEIDKYKMEVFKDGVNAGVYASDSKAEEVIVSKSDSINVIMAKGGDQAAILTPTE